MKLTQLIGVASVFALVACSAAQSDEGVSPGEAEEGEVETSADELTGGVTTYYSVRRDTRRCVSPLCGGYWVSRVNRATTRCANGTHEQACYVTELNLSALGLSADAASETTGDPSRLVLRGTVQSKTHPNFGALGTFRASEAWRAPASGEATGTFYVLDDSNIRCFRAPCPSTRERKLNFTSSKNITGVDLSDAPGTDEAKSKAVSGIASQGLIVAGVNVGGASALVLDGSQFYSRVQKSAGLPAGAECTGADVCGAGLRCCYPCGIRGCTNRCITPTASGDCPMFL